MSDNSDAKRVKLTTVVPTVADILASVPSDIPPGYTTDTRWLSRVHGHDRDRQIFFSDPDHRYLVRWNDKDLSHAQTSTSGVVASPFAAAEFDADLCIRRIKQGKNYASSKYYGMSSDEIKQSWEDNKNDAATKGTRMHDILERHINGESITDAEKSLPEVRQYLELEKFFLPLHNLAYYRTEWRLWTDETTKLAGMADLLCVPKTQDDPDVLHLWLLDHKRSKDVSKRSEPCGQSPCEHLKGNKYTKYSLALNMYTVMIEDYYRDFVWQGNPGHIYPRAKIDRMFLDVCHPNQSTYVMMEVFDHRDTVRELIAKFKIKN